MDLELTEEQRFIQQTARDFAAREVAPKAADLDKTGRWPTELVERMGELGFLGVAVPPEWGGAGLDAIGYVLAMEEISAACASTGVIMSVNNSLFCDPIVKFGTELQKRDVLTPAASGKALGCFGLTEPMSGSDAQTMITVGEQQGDGSWIVNGSKNFITNGPEADFILVFAITSREGGKAKHTCFIIPTDAPGYSVGKHDEKLGIHAAHSCTVFLDNVKVPKEMVLGEPGSGFKVAMATLDGGRIGIAAQALGIAKAAFEKSVAYAKERKSFGKPIAEHQAIQFMLSDMATELDAARLLTLRAASMKDAGARHSMESAEAKLFASEVATRIAHKAIQVHGGYGYTTEYGVERHYRDARITEIYEGTSEIQRIVIAANLLKLAVLLMRRIASVLVLSALASGCGSSAPPPAKEPDKKPEPKAQKSTVPDIKGEIGALDERAVTKTFERLMRKVEVCQDERRKQNEKLDFVAGDVALEIRVKEDGSAREVFLTRTTIGDRALEKCIVGEARKIDWPKPVGGREGIAKNGFSLPMKGDRDAVAWDESKVTTELGRVRGALRGCKAPKGTQVTLYVDASGKVLAGGASSSADGGEAAADCLVEQASKMKLPSPGGWPAKVTFSVE